MGSGMTPERMRYEDQRTETDKLYAKATDEAFDALEAALTGHGLKVPMDDRAERLVTEIFKMVADANDPRP